MIYVDETDPDEEAEPPFEPREVTLKRNENINEAYALQDELGRGKFGTVFRCKEKTSGRVLAAKFIVTPKKEDRQDVLREVEIMRSLQHPRLLQLYDVYDDGKAQMILVLEIIEGGELFERVIDDDFVLTEKACSIFVRQICEGIDYMHSKNILHLDMKPENVMCTTRTGNRIKLIDFGLARFFEPGKKLQVLFGTPEFVAPEVVNFDKVCYRTDMWSVGVICYVLLSGLSPFMGNSELETMANVTKAEYDFDDESFDEISNEAKDFIAKLLLKDREERLTAKQCLDHPWLRKREKKKDEAQLDKKKLKRYVIRRRWQKVVNAILALRRMGAPLTPTDS
ncbi:myosin light chain kinase, smooth muscle-like [Ornithodoros turicata]|uniref:myosin light chain kinase, smooth muscle-like n=1 Tax=Ornithodoros turicata TaxID=34597 RepID=UPI003139102B